MSLAGAAIAVLREHGIDVQPGLTEIESVAVEQRFGFAFAPVHRAFLRLGLPVGAGWPDWRNGSDTELAHGLAGPVDGVLFEVEHNGFWLGGWGPEPATADQRIGIAGAQLVAAPRLVPVYRQRFMPAAPAPEPTPVLSVHQTDVIYYGRDLLSYVRAEFAGRPREPAGARPVPFWSALAAGGPDEP